MASERQQQDRDARQQAIRKEIEEACLQQLMEEGRITMTGAQERTKISRRQLIADHFDECRKALASQFRYLLIASKDADFPVEAAAELRRWSMEKSEKALAADKAKLKESWTEFRQAQRSFQEERDRILADNAKLSEALRAESQAREHEATRSQSTIEDLKAEKNGMSAELSKIRQENGELKARLDVSEAHAAGLEKQLSDLRRQNEDLSDSVAKASYQHQADLKSLNDYERKIDRLSIQLESEKSHAIEIEKAHQIRESSWLTERDQLKEAIQAGQSRIESMLEVKKQNEAEIDRLQSGIDHKESDLAKQAKRVQTLEIEMAGLIARKESLADDKKALEAKAKEAENEIIKLNKRATLLQDRLEVLTEQSRK